MCSHYVALYCQISSTSILVRMIDSSNLSGVNHLGIIITVSTFLGLMCIISIYTEIDVYRQCANEINETILRAAHDLKLVIFGTGLKEVFRYLNCDILLLYCLVLTIWQT